MENKTMGEKQMNTAGTIKIRLRNYSEKDLNVLERLVGDPKMMEHLGGPETEEKILERHKRYCDDKGCYIIIQEDNNESFGWIGYWERTWKNNQVWETGWSVLPEYQGRGIATKAIKQLIQIIKRERKFSDIHAFPGVENMPSNAICKKMGLNY